MIHRQDRVLANDESRKKARRWKLRDVRLRYPGQCAEEKRMLSPRAFPPEIVRQFRQAQLFLRNRQSTADDVQSQD